MKYRYEYIDKFVDPIIADVKSRHVKERSLYYTIKPTFYVDAYVLLYINTRFETECNFILDPVECSVQLDPDGHIDVQLRYLNS